MDSSEGLINWLIANARKGGLEEEEEEEEEEKDDVVRHSLTHSLTTLRDNIYRAYTEVNKPQLRGPARHAEHTIRCLFIFFFFFFF